MTANSVAKVLETDPSRIYNLCRGGTFPKPHELDALENLFGLPAEVLFEPAMLEYRNNWPPPRGAYALRRELDRLRAQLSGE